MLDWLKKFWWVVLLVLAYIAYLFVKVTTAGQVDLPVVTPVKAKIKQTDAEATVKKIKVEADAKKRRAQIEDIKKVKDSEERLARWKDLLTEMDKQL